MKANKEYEIQIEIENACLLNCVHCSSDEMRKSGKRSYSDETVIDFISQFPGPVHIYLTGGDPVLYPGLINLCQRITTCKENASIGLYTTGNCPQMQPVSINLSVLMARSGVTDCYFSIYDDDPMNHDFFTGRAGSFQNTIISVNNLCLAGIVPKAHLVLTKRNYTKLDNIINFCGDVGFAEVRILKLTPSGNAKNNWEWIGLHYEEQDRIITSLIHHRKDYNVKLSFSGYPHLHPCRASINSYMCQAGTNLLYITLAGDIYPCACTVRFAERYKLGNINTPNDIIEQIDTQYSNNYNRFCLTE